MFDENRLEFLKSLQLGSQVMLVSPNKMDDLQVNTVVEIWHNRRQPASGNPLFSYRTRYPGIPGREFELDNGKKFDGWGYCISGGIRFKLVPVKQHLIDKHNREMVLTNILKKIRLASNELLELISRSLDEETI